MPTGRLRIDHNTGISSLQENTGTRRLARQGPDNLFANATRFLVNERGLQDGDFISVTAGPGTTPAVIFVLDASLAAPVPVPLGASLAAPVPKLVGASKTAAKKIGKKARKTTKRAAGKKAAKKAAKKSTKKAASKKATKKAAKKTGTRKSGKQR